MGATLVLVAAVPLILLRFCFSSILISLKSCTAAEVLLFLFRTVAPCVHRRWMGDALDASEQSMFNFDTAAVHAAFMQTIVDNQGPNGDVPTVGPGPGTFPFLTH